jgi:adenylate cyclase, class 2
MAFINIEIKARTDKPDRIRQYLTETGAEYRGIDRQIDTYFKVDNGRLKLRQGNIENNLIYYSRAETSGLKQSEVEMVKSGDAEGLKNVLTKALSVKTVVSKEREIYYISNVKFHIDKVDGLGSFVEIEASNRFEDVPEEKLRQQCRKYMEEFGIGEEDLINKSYSDMVLAKMG